MINIIAAVAKNNVIGIDGHLPWQIKQDLDYFYKKTDNSVLIMGKNTYLEIGKAISGRQIIVLTSEQIDVADGVMLCESFNDALKKAKDISKINNWNEIFVCGGQQVYQFAINFVDRLYITRINKDFEGDRFFPEIDTNSFTLISSRKHQIDDSIEINFCIYDKVS